MQNVVVLRDDATKSNETADRMSIACCPLFVIVTLCVACTAVLTGCAAPGNALEVRARRAGFERSEVQGAAFAHLIYRNRVPVATDGSTPLLVFLEGDGVPWVNGGRTPATDPTPRRALAFELMLATPLPALYLTRPCYNGLREACAHELWTHARYSPAVVDSLVQALKNYTSRHPDVRLLLVGYSGGGALAVLMAPQLEKLAGVVTLAANLDTKRWTELHHYQPLVGSLDPASEPVADIPLEIHLTGGRDANVPEQLLVDYRSTHPKSRFWSYAEFDHACCWLTEWPAALNRILPLVQQRN